MAEPEVGPSDPLALMCEDLDAGFALLVKAHQNVIYSVALQISGARTDAEDLAAETFLRAYRVLRNYDRERISALRSRAWLMTILLNLWRNTTRDRSRRPRQVPLDEISDVPSTAPGAEEVVERGERERELAAMLGTLPVAQRMSVVLRHVVGFSVSEIADVLDCPEGTVKSHISRGLRRLRQLYQVSPDGSDRAGPVCRAPGQPRLTLVTAVLAGGSEPS